MSFFCHLVVISSKYIYLIKAIYEVSVEIFPRTYIWNQMYYGEQENINKPWRKRTLSFVSIGSDFKQDSEENNVNTNLNMQNKF